VIQPEEIIVDNVVDEYQCTIWLAPHTGYAFKEDNHLVY
jgi:hypothetical protein